MTPRQIADGNGLIDQTLVAHDMRHAKILRDIAAASGDVPDAEADMLSAIEKAMAALPADTIDGLQAKARTLRRLLDQENEEWDDDISRMARSLARDLTRES